MIGERLRHILQPDVKAGLPVIINGELQCRGYRGISRRSKALRRSKCHKVLSCCDSDGSSRKQGELSRPHHLFETGLVVCCPRCGGLRCEIAQQLRQAFRNDRIIAAFRPFVHVCHKPNEDGPRVALRIHPLGTNETRVLRNTLPDAAFSKFVRVSGACIFLTMPD
jgi:hypothetical protein